MNRGRGGPKKRISPPFEQMTRSPVEILAKNLSLLSGNYKDLDRKEDKLGSALFQKDTTHSTIIEKIGQTRVRVA